MVDVDIPDCVCQTLEAARFLLQTRNLNVGSILSNSSVTDRNTAYVWKQNPPYEPDAILRVGDQVDLWLTQELPANCPENR
jgi:hypothetical protein